VPGPKILELLCWVKQRFFDRSRNSVIEALDQPEILWSFQKLWKMCFGTNRDSGVVRKFWTRFLGSDIDSVIVPEILE
jgi:hypothetical protein